jgi:heptosyltransferase-2
MSLQTTTPPEFLGRPLIVRLCNMVGDVVLGLPALQLLGAHGFDLQLYGKGWASALLAGEGWACTKRAGKLSERTAQLRALRVLCQAQDPHFDRRTNTLVMPNSFSSAFEARWAGLKPAGYARDGRSLLLKQAWQPDSQPGTTQHALEGFWGLACRLTGHQGLPPDHITLAVLPADQLAADQLLAARGIQPGFTCIVPFAAGDVDGLDKRWPDFAAFTQALSDITKQRDQQIVTCPGPGELSIATEQHPAAICLNELGLGTYLGVLKRAGLVIPNDTGPAHMAAAVGTRVLSVLGPTKPEQWRPWGPQNLIAQGTRPQWPSIDQVMQLTLKAAP